MNLSKNIDIILQKVTLTAKRIFGEKLHSVILYGSYARGDYTKDSDVDIMILADIQSDESRLYQETFTDLCSDLGLEYDLLIVATIQDIATFKKYLNVLPFFQNIEKEGIKVAV